MIFVIAIALAASLYSAATLRGRMIKRIAIFVASCMLLTPLAAESFQQPDLATADWSANATHNLAKNPPASQTVWTFMNKLWNPSIRAPELVPGDGKLCWFRFVDLRRSDELSLVAVYDLGGTADCNELTVFDKTPAGIEMYDYSGALVSTELTVVKDINGVGQFELVVFDRLAPLGEDLDWTNEWPSVYAWTSDNYTNVSAQYRSCYQTWLAALKKEIAKMKRERVAQNTATPSAPNGIVSGNNGIMIENLVQSPEPATPPSVGPEVGSAGRIELDCKQAEAAKIERFLGTKDAGMLDAIRWANSDDPRERGLAAQVFADMGTSEALRYEQTLSHDAVLKVAKLASFRIKHWNENDPYFAATFDRESPGN